MATDNTNHRPAKRCKVAGSVSYGTAPPEFTGENKETMIFRIHNFAELKEKRGEKLYTNSIKACGHRWKLKLYPRGRHNSETNVECITIILQYAGENAKTNPITARACIRIKGGLLVVESKKYWKGQGQGYDSMRERQDFIRNDLDNNGTLIIEVDIEVATTTKITTDVWYPQFKVSNHDLGSLLYRSIEETADVSFLVGKSKQLMKAHMCVLSVRAKELYGLITTVEEGDEDGDEEEATSSSKDRITHFVLPDIDPKAFEAFLGFVYDYDNVPVFEYDNTNKGDGTVEENDANNNMLLENAKTILLVADRFGCTDLKLYIESILVDTFLTSSKAAGLLLFADSYSCPLLKEACMHEYTKNPNAFMTESDGSGKNDTEGNAVARSTTTTTTITSYWNQLQESSKLLAELLLFATTTTSGRKQYSSVTGDGDGTIDEADEYDVTSLRERLEKYDLDLDGSREILVQRWQQFLSDV